MTSRNQRLRQQCQRQVEEDEGVNYAQARAAYGAPVADAIFHELDDDQLAYVSPREHDRLVEWKATGDRRINGIVANIVDYTLSVSETA